jgi:ribosomal protein S12 methylthiotransferase
MMTILNGAGWVSSADASEADLIIINSCGFIESAKQESINAVLGWRKTYPGKKIILAGCLAQRYAWELAESLPEADLFFGNADLSKITEALSLLMSDSRKVLIPPLPEKSPVLPRRNGSAENGLSGEAQGVLAGKRHLLSLPGSAYVKISEGCNNRCAFCSIPLIRGGLRSRPIPQVLAECRELLGRGIRELCLIGQDLGSYGTDFSPPVRGGQGRTETAGPGCRLPELLGALSLLEGSFWARLLYIHPDNFPLSVLEPMRRDGRLLPYFDIPFQHGSAKILKAMNRRGNAESYLALIEKIRTIFPDAVIRSTFLTGFPGETDEDFQALLDFQEKACIDWMGCFTYSREEDTPAYSMKARVPKKIAAQRKLILEEQQIPITEKRMERFIGREMDVLVEEAVSDPYDSAGEGIYLGRLFCQAPEVDGAAVISAETPLTLGSLVRGKVFSRAGFDLEVAVIRP